MYTSIQYAYKVCRYIILPYTLPNSVWERDKNASPKEATKEIQMKKPMIAKKVLNKFGDLIKIVYTMKIVQN